MLLFYCWILLLLALPSYGLDCCTKEPCRPHKWDEVTACVSTCYLRTTVRGGVEQRGCFDKWQGSPVDHSYEGCRMQHYLGEKIEWCFCRNGGKAGAPCNAQTREDLHRNVYKQPFSEDPEPLQSPATNEVTWWKRPQHKTPALEPKEGVVTKPRQSQQSHPISLQQTDFTTGMAMNMYGFTPAQPNTAEPTRSPAMIAAKSPGKLIEVQGHAMPPPGRRRQQRKPTSTVRRPTYASKTSNIRPNVRSDAKPLYHATPSTPFAQAPALKRIPTMPLRSKEDPSTPWQGFNSPMSSSKNQPRPGQMMEVPSSARYSGSVSQNVPPVNTMNPIQASYYARRNPSASGEVNPTQASYNPAQAAFLSSQVAYQPLRSTYPSRPNKQSYSGSKPLYANSNNLLESPYEQAKVYNNPKYTNGSPKPKVDQDLLDQYKKPSKPEQKLVSRRPQYGPRSQPQSPVVHQASSQQQQPGISRPVPPPPSPSRIQAQYRPQPQQQENRQSQQGQSNYKPLVRTQYIYPPSPQGNSRPQQQPPPKPQLRRRHTSGSETNALPPPTPQPLQQLDMNRPQTPQRLVQSTDAKSGYGPRQQLGPEDAKRAPSSSSIEQSRQSKPITISQFRVSEGQAPRPTRVSPYSHNTATHNFNTPPPPPQLGSHHHTNNLGTPKQRSPFTVPSGRKPYFNEAHYHASNDIRALPPPPPAPGSGMFQHQGAPYHRQGTLRPPPPPPHHSWHSDPGPSSDGGPEAKSLPRGLPLPAPAPPHHFRNQVTAGSTGITKNGYNGLDCFVCHDSSPYCGVTVSNPKRVTVARCNTKCFVKQDPNGKIYRGCFDGWVTSSFVSDYDGCRQQTFGNYAPTFCFCKDSLCNGASYEAMGGKSAGVSAPKHGLSPIIPYLSPLARQTPNEPNNNVYVPKNYPGHTSHVPKSSQVQANIARRKEKSKDVDNLLVMFTQLCKKNGVIRRQGTSHWACDIPLPK